MLPAIPKPPAPTVCNKVDELERRRKSVEALQTKSGHRGQVKVKKSAPKDRTMEFGYATKIGLIHVKANEPIYDDEYYENLAAEKTAVELIQYLKDNWKLHIDKKSSLIDITFRTINMLYHKNPPNYWLEKRARQKVSDYSGFFSNVRKPYLPLGEPELDTPTLVFDNLPEQLKVDSLEWYLELERRREEERRRNAPLPKLPRERISRPKFAKGRIRQGVGGTTAVDDFVKIATQFQREIRGTMTFTKLLNQWKESKEDEAANRGSPFGVLHHRSAIVELTSKDNPEKPENEAANENDTAKNKRKSSTVDDRVYQHQMLHLEKMMAAIYAILKSLLNIKTTQIESVHRIPLSVVMSLREHSPETKLHTKRHIPTELNKSKYHGLQAVSTRTLENASEQPATEQAPAPSQPKQEEAPAATGPKRSRSGSKSGEKTKYKGTGRAVPAGKLDEEDIREIIPLDDPCDRAERKDHMTLFKTVIKSPSYLDDRPPMLKSTTMAREPPEATAKRNGRYDRRYRALFDRKHLQTPPPQWHNVRLETFDYGFNKFQSSFDDHKKSVMALLEYGKQQDDLPFTALRPDPGEIPTPKLPNSQSLHVLSSEEKSRLNLLAKCPGADSEEPIPQEILKLYTVTGIKTTSKDMYRTVMKMKKAFNDVEKNVSTYYLNEIEKFEWDTMKRYKTKIGAIEPEPVFEWSIASMRNAMLNPVEEIDDSVDEHGMKRQSIWFKTLLQKCQEVGGMKHQGCKEMLLKLQKYCDIDIKTRPNMMNRFCLLVLSLPTTELGTPYFQEAIFFLLDGLFGSPKELFYQWLRERGLPCLL